MEDLDKREKLVHIEGKEGVYVKQNPHVDYSKLVPVPCPSPQMMYAKTVQQCYHLGAVDMSEVDAVAYCMDLYPGTRLASVLSQQEQDAIDGNAHLHFL